ncbi:hypothetical protein R1sor_024388 [Riccia sorocarpa]|uniref:Uncharacterized protein n=1 Tax=Riccia sorocarpa TaxID=122646 RepID=A0ABD3GSL7_9MARC
MWSITIIHIDKHGVFDIPQGASEAEEGAGVVAKPWARARVKRPPVQILVVVANIQMRTLKTEVEKGSA